MVTELTHAKDVLSTPKPDDEIGIVYFGNEWFAENRTSSHHIARRLPAHAKVLYVDSPGMRAPTTSGRDLSRLWRKLAQTFRRPLQVQEGLWHCTVPQFPWRQLPFAKALSRHFGAWAVRRALKQVGIQRPILWFVVPHPSFMLDVVPHDLAVYYCIDDYAAHPGVDVALITACDEDLTRRCDLVFVAPPTLVEAKRAMNPHTTYSPHGVDVELFSKAQWARTPVPAGAQGLSSPVIGYFGLIAAWTDVELLVWLAQQRPEWTFLLVGHAHVDVSALNNLANVRMVGAQPYESLPGWAKAFDVAIIPYRQNRQVQNANPLKLREYLATGKPVVTMPTAEVQRFSDVVHIATDRQTFLAGIETALVGREDEQACARRMASIASMSWDARVQETVTAVLARRHQSELPPAPRHAR